MAKQINMINYGSVSENKYSLILSPQIIRQIQINVDDSITAKDGGARSCPSIAFVSLFKPTSPNNFSRVRGSFESLCRCEIRLEPWLDAKTSDFGPRQNGTK